MASSAPGSRDGDWRCDGCGNKNYDFRSLCNRCKQPRLLVDSRTPSDSKWLRRIGDWICAGCSNNNYASRDECNKCGTLKEVSALPAMALPGAAVAAPTNALAHTGGLGLGMHTGLLHHIQPTWQFSGSSLANSLANSSWRPGDWLCKCGFHNYSSRSTCKKCSTPMPMASLISAPPTLPPGVSLSASTIPLLQAAALPQGLQHCSIPKMVSVVASITGYVGDERSNLIKLINSSGAYYVGKLLKGSITHLVCCTFDGPKYKMAKRFRIRIINHQWFEDCVKAGKRLDESPYTTLSGREVGALVWNAPKRESSSSHHAKLKLELSSKHAFNKDYQPNNARAEGFCELLPYHVGDSLLRSQRTLSDEILDVSDDDHELQVLLQNKPTRRDNGKRKASLVLMNRSLTHKTVPKHKRKSIASPTHAEQRKYVDTRNRVTHSILEYVHLIDDMEADNYQRSSRQILQQDDFEDSNEAPFTSRANQKSFTLLNSIRHRKEGRLVRKTEIMKDHNSFDTLVSEIADLAHTCKDIKATPRREVIQDEPSSSRSPDCTDATFFKDLENFSGSPVACTLVPADIDCAICHTDHITSAKGVLSCGHHFCYQCIMKWALEVASKTPTCPLCKAPFDMINKREQRPGSSEKVSYEESVVMLGCFDKGSSEQLEESTPILSCILCGIGDMQELLLTCSGCGARSAHSFCLDPPLPPLSNAPWFCGRCSQRRRADTTWWHQLHLFDS